MNNYEDIIEQIHRLSMQKRELESSTAPTKTHLAWPRIAIAASISAIVCLSLVAYLGNQHKSLDTTKVVASNKSSHIDEMTIELQTCQQISDSDSTSNGGGLSVVCPSKCDVNEVLQRFEQTLMSLN